MESFIGLCLLLGVGHILRMKVKLLQKLYLPSCVIAGLMGLIVIQSVSASGGELPAAWTAGWSKLPGLLINVVFACLFLGITVPGLRTIWRHAGPQLAYGQVVAWGQYVVGVGLVLVLLGPLFNVPAMVGGIVPVGFEGGHGTAGGMKEVFADYGFPEGGDLGLASATAGMIGAIVVGMILINWGTRRGYVTKRMNPEDMTEDDSIGVIPVDQRPSAGKLTVRSDAIEAFTLHLVFVGVAIAFGFLLKEGMKWIELTVNADLIAQINAGTALKNDRVRTVAYVLRSFPLFPLCMIGGILVQIWSQKFDRRKLLDPGLIRRIQNVSLDFLVVAAIAMIKIETLTAYLAPFAILVAAGIGWNVFCVLFLARRMLPDAWFERSIAEMGQSMGVTATGLLLLRVVDPEYKTPAADAFAYKQIMHEPFMGGGLWTSTAVPLLATWALFGVVGLPVFFIALGAVAFWLFLVFVLRIFPRTSSQ